MLLSLLQGWNNRCIPWDASGGCLRGGFHVRISQLGNFEQNEQNLSGELLFSAQTPAPRQPTSSPGSFRNARHRLWGREFPLCGPINSSNDLTSLASLLLVDGPGYKKPRTLTSMPLCDVRGRSPPLRVH